jgi:hypothetical protein
LDQVQKDLTDVVKVCEGASKQTNHLRTLMSALTKGMHSFQLAFSEVLTRKQVKFRNIGGATK